MFTQTRKSRRRWFGPAALIPAVVILAALPASALFLAGCGKDNPAGPQVPAGWKKSYSMNIWSAGNAVRQTSDGGYIIAGWNGPSEVNADVLLLKTNAAGDSLWARSIDAPGWASGVSVLQTLDGGYLVLADYQGNTGEFWLIKTDANGNMVWNQFKGYSDRNEVASEVQPTSDGGYIVIGTTNLGGGDFDIWLVKTGPGGETQWYREKGFGDRQEFGASIQQTADGGYLMVGTTYGGGSAQHSMWLVKTYADGSTHWYKTIPTGEAQAKGIRKTTDGAYVIMGDVMQDGRRVVALVKCDDSGNMPWAKPNDGSGDFRGGEVQQTGDGGFMVAGTRWLDSSSGSDFCLIKFDGTGNTLWTKTFGSGDDDCHSGGQTADGGYILCGSTSTPGVDGCRVWLVKTDPDGNL